MISSTWLPGAIVLFLGLIIGLLLFLRSRGSAESRRQDTDLTAEGDPLSPDPRTGDRTEVASSRTTVKGFVAGVAATAIVVVLANWAMKDSPTVSGSVEASPSPERPATAIPAHQ
ncbi:MAG: hypothetical protein K8J08_04760, partial [Thermoanaerobaculia bacterium]|nr:hypothetical protein [Thermoanaerobaculia bacterium]